MTKVEGDIYSCELPADAPNIIFNNGKDQTADLKVPADKNMYDFSTGEWSVYGEVEQPEDPTEPEQPTDPTEPADPTQPTEPATDAGEVDASEERAVPLFLLIITIIAAIVAVGMVILLIVKKVFGK
jgi:outer membrane biosynthesis protein TonB